MGKKTEKFLFNQHIFDEPDIEDDEFEEPPAPMFSEEELETIRAKTESEAYRRGKTDGIAESKASRDQMVAQIMQNIAQDASILFSNEQTRDEIFERESVNLARTIFEKLFPMQKELHGFDELKSNISRILKSQENQSEIAIEVHPDAVEGVHKYIQELNLHNHSQQRFDVSGNESLDAQTCKMFWKDGGAIRDIDAIAEEIRGILHQTLAGAPPSSHDSNNGDATDALIGTKDAITDNTPPDQGETDDNNSSQEPENGLSDEEMEKPNE